METCLKVDWASYEAAKFACENWHYSKCVPAGKIVKIGAWENEKFIGVVLFSRGASPRLMMPYGLTQYEGCELTRIALTKHKTPVSKILMIAIRLLKKTNPGLKLIVSFADPTQGHHGGIYQATNWIYSGLQSAGGAREYLIGNKWVHTKSACAKFGTQSHIEITKRYPEIKARKVTRKYRFLFPLTPEMRTKIEHLKQPYPKRVASIENDVLSDQEREGGVNPTATLQLIIAGG